MSWSNNENFEKDLYAFSENQVSPNDEFEPPPVTVTQWNALMDSNRGKSIYDPDNFETDVIIISSGRGRGCRSEFYRPGAPIICSSTRDEDDIRKRLREVNPHVNITANVVNMNEDISEYDTFCDAPEIHVNVNHNFTNSSLSECFKNGSSTSSSILKKHSKLMPLDQMRKHAKHISGQKLYSEALKQESLKK